MEMGRDIDSGMGRVCMVRHLGRSGFEGVGMFGDGFWGFSNACFGYFAFNVIFCLEGAYRCQIYLGI